jgi:hypothetical protein
MQAVESVGKRCDQFYLKIGRFLARRLVSPIFACHSGKNQQSIFLDTFNPSTIA